MSKKSPFSGFLKELPQNMFSGFVVSLIALPLGLGLAMASEAPPIAGIIAAVVGGMVVALFGGSFVTITGPGNGLVGVLLLAITAMGLQSTYAAIICSGVLLLVLGFLRLGKLSDFFPSSAIQGMLAAIGLIILGKQFHTMLGNSVSLPNSIAYLTEIPSTLYKVTQFKEPGLWYAAGFGILSLLIMVVYPKIRNKYLQLIPAPMWIVLISIGFSYYFEWLLQKPNPIAAAYMLSGIPSIQKIIADLPTPDFGNTTQIAFWGHVVALTLVASIESILSIKAVDKLDPKKRRSNINKDLKALGLATIGSGFLGGLNVVTVIARSSVNANNGGTNRAANFSHALFLLLFIALFSTQLSRIPLPALMAILVFTGYKLASPRVVKQILYVGREQLIIFFTTLFVTLKVSLISGILAGVVITFIIHIIMNKSLSLFVRNFLKPNVLLFQEDDGKGRYYISVKHYCTFLNYYKLKQKMEAIAESENVVVDFSMCQFVDHTVMENLHNYQELFDKKGGVFEVIGLDWHDADSTHPFALRRILPMPEKKNNNLSKRQTSLKQLALDYQIEYASGKQKNIHFLDGFLYFKTKQISAIYNRLYDHKNTFTLFDIVYSEGEFIAKEVMRRSMMYIAVNKEIPVFSLDREGFLERLYAFAGFKDINLPNHSDFSKRFYLLGENPKAIRTFFNDEVVRFFESNPYYHVESNGHALLLFGKERLAGNIEIKTLLDFGQRLQTTVNTCC